MKYWWISILFLLPVNAHSQLKLAPVFSSNMVFQQKAPVYIFGKGVPGEQIFVEWGDEHKHPYVGSDSTWVAQFDAKDASFETYTISIANNRGELLQLQNVLIGDVWLCLGQSNMQWPVASEEFAAETIPQAEIPGLRFYNPSYAGENIYSSAFSDSVIKLLSGNDFYKGEWQESNSQTVRAMSAVGFYFGRKILNSESIPIGLIDLSIGGAPIESFIRPEALLQDSNFKKKMSGDWIKNEHLPIWPKERGLQNLGTRTGIPGDEYGGNHGFKPGFAFDAGLRSLTNFPVAGIIWYQGESNAQEQERVNEYNDLMKLMIGDYRELWKNPAMPFYWVQLSSIDTANYKSHYWPEFRNNQRLLLDQISHSGMAVSSDIGAKNDVHPRNKKWVGERLANWALNNYYKRKVTVSGPLPLSAKWKNGKLIVTFQYARGLTAKDKKIIRGFSVNGKPIDVVKVKGNKVILRPSEKPQTVEYGWSPFTDANLVNNEDLPASTFSIKVN